MNTTMASTLPTLKLNFLQLQMIPPNSFKKGALKPAFCSAVQRVEIQEEKVGILCEPCNGTGWLLCDFCKGQKTNVKSKTNRIYRRCPSCKATGYILCAKCKVFKCVTFPNESDGERLGNACTKGNVHDPCVGRFCGNAPTQIPGTLAWYCYAVIQQEQIQKNVQCTRERVSCSQWSNSSEVVLSDEAIARIDRLLVL